MVYLPIKSILSKVSVVNNEEHKGTFLQERWHIEPKELFCILHYCVGETSLYYKSTAMRHIIVLGIQKVQQCFVSGVMVASYGQSQHLRFPPALLSPESSILVPRLQHDLPLGFRAKHQVLV